MIELCRFGGNKISYRIKGGDKLKRIDVQKAGIVILTFLKNFFLLVMAYFLVEVLTAVILKPQNWSSYIFSLLWAFLFSAVALLLPRLAGRIWFGITYFVFLAWSMAQTGYYRIFGKLMWISDVFFADEGAGYIGDVLSHFPAIWWIGGVLLIALGVLIIWKFPKMNKGFGKRIPYIAISAVSAVMLFVLPELVFLRDNLVWGTRSEYGQSSSYRATYNTMYDACKVYNICGIYQLTLRDVWEHELYPLTPAHQEKIQDQTEQIDAYFAEREEHEENSMTGLFAGKNVVLVLMESMDDWMITREDTPTLYQMRNEGINFTQFYTPGYGSARTINSEFCINTGIYLPTNGNYVFNYVTNGFNQSLAFQAVDNGYSAEVFHYNTASFYSRGVFEPAMGYNAYNSYSDYETDKNKLYDDCLLFDIPELNDLFFREGQTFNTIITRSAHLSYAYNEVLSNYGLSLYPEYRGMYASEEEDCARLKAKLVDDMFARLLAELEENGQLDNTVIIAVTDHYTYGYKATNELLALSGVQETLLLEKTPCFVWSTDCPSMEVEKTLNTSDFVPTVLNLLGIESPYDYLGQDAFDPNYVGYALFPDGSWISEGVACEVDERGSAQVIYNQHDKEITQEYLDEMSQTVQEYININNLLLTSDYYASKD